MKKSMNKEHISKLRKTVLDDASLAATEIWDKYVEYYRKLETNLNDIDLSLEEKRELTKLFDDKVKRMFG